MNVILISNSITILAGQALEDQCSKKPCQNGGECIQVKYGRYKCDCQGTKHYGNHCEIGNKENIKLFIIHFQYPTSIASLSFSNDGSVLAIASSYMHVSMCMLTCV